jgi:hypothetical protein
MAQRERGRPDDNEAAPDVDDREVRTHMSTAAVLVARIRNRERVMASIQERNPHDYHHNPFYTKLHSAVVAYRDALHHLERVAVREDAEVATATA